MAKVVRELVTKWTYKVDAKQVKDTVKAVKGLRKEMKMVGKDSVAFSKREFRRVRLVSQAWQSLRATVRGTGDEIVRTGRKARRSGGGPGGGAFKTFALARGLGVGAAGAAGLAGGGAIAAITGIGASLKAAATKQVAQIEIGGLLGDQAAGNALLERLRTFAAETPFQLDQLRDLTKRLLAGGFSEQEIIPTLQTLGDLTAGNADALNRMLVNFIEIRGNNKAFTRDLRQFNNVGIPVVQKLKEQLGVTGEEFEKMVSGGQITFDTIQNAFAAMTGEGGRFHRRMERISKTLSGRFSNFIDVLGILAVEVGEIFMGPAESIMTNLMFIVEGFRSLTKALKDTGHAMHILVSIGALLTAVFAPAALVILGIFLVLEDILAFVQGRDSIIGRVKQGIEQATVEISQWFTELGKKWDTFVDGLKKDFPIVSATANIVSSVASFSDDAAKFGLNNAVQRRLEASQGGGDATMNQTNQIQMPPNSNAKDIADMTNRMTADGMKVMDQKTRPKVAN